MTRAKPPRPCEPITISVAPLRAYGVEQSVDDRSLDDASDRADALRTRRGYRRVGKIVASVLHLIRDRPGIDRGVIGGRSQRRDVDDVDEDETCSVFPGESSSQCHARLGWRGTVDRDQDSLENAHG